MLIILISYYLLFLTAHFFQNASSFIITSFSLNKPSSKLKMSWADTWSDIVNGGNPRWKVQCEKCHAIALEHFQTFVKTDPSQTKVFCPLAGDDPFVYLLFSRGYSVVTIDLVPLAVQQMKALFGSDETQWKKEEKDGTTLWIHDSGRATLMVGDALQVRPELLNTFDAVYDKDSFGALQKEMRVGYCSRLAEYLKKDGIVYLECKLRDNHEESKNNGPPFSLTRKEIMEESSYGKHFDYVKGLGQVYDISMPMKQTGHILTRK